MTDTTNVDDIVVYGNRRPHGSSGPYGGSGSGGGGDSGGPHQQEVDPEDPNPPEDPWNPCDTPDKRREKAVDAAAAEAVAEIERLASAAGEDSLNYRERGCYLYLNPDGSVRRGTIFPGPPFAHGGVGMTPLD